MSGVITQMVRVMNDPDCGIYFLANETTTDPPTPPALFRDLWPTRSGWKGQGSDGRILPLEGEDLIGGRAFFVDDDTVKAGETGATTIAIDSTGQNVIAFDGELSADITASGAGGLDTGSRAADNWYHAHVIAAKDGTPSPALMLSLSQTAPTLPTGFDIFRRLFAVRNDGTNVIRPFNQSGTGKERSIWWDDEKTNLQAFSGTMSSSYSPVDLSAFMPPTSFDVYLTANFLSKGDKGNIAEFRPDGATMDASPIFLQNTAQERAAHHFQMSTGDAQSVDLRDADTDDEMDLYVRGYTERVGA